MKKSMIAFALVVLLAACLCVSCNNNPKDSSSGKDIWISAEITETYEEDSSTYTSTSTMTLVFDGKGNITVVKNIDTLLKDGEDITDELSEEEGTVTMTGTYTAVSDVQGTLSYKDESTQKTITCNYAIQGNQLMLSSGGTSRLFTKR